MNHHPALKRLAAALLIAAAAVLSAAEPSLPTLTAAKLSSHPAGLGPRASDRAAWSQLFPPDTARRIIAAAAELPPTPGTTPDALYLEFFTNGNRTHYQNALSSAQKALTLAVIAEGLEYRGRFLPRIETELRYWNSLKTWVLPAHDLKRNNFDGRQTDIDLVSSKIAWEIATVLWLLGDKLSPATVAQCRENIDRRVLHPFREMVEGKRERNWWMTTHNNWNAVCLTGVIGAALATVESREERLFFLRAGLQYSRNFLKGFPPDGYCSEGVGYWGYGFGHYLMLAEMVRRATDGEVNLLDDPRTAAPASYPERIRIVGDTYPTFADAPFRSRISPFWLGLRDSLLGRLSVYRNQVQPDPHLPLAQAMLAASLPRPPAAAIVPAEPTGEPRSFFPDGGVLICRPSAPGNRLAAAMKGGSNHEMHNHSDIGSYSVLVDGVPVAADPGSEIYTARTFSSKRYESNVINSFGHPVPLIDGMRQRNGKGTDARTVSTTFTPEHDRWTIDMKGAYEVDGLESLQRTFTYSRRGAGEFEVLDRGSFKRPVSFSVAVITMGKMRRISDHAFILSWKNKELRAEVRTKNGEFEITAEPLRENLPGGLHPLRVAVTLREKVAEPEIAIVFTPVTTTKKTPEAP